MIRHLAAGLFAATLAFQPYPPAFPRTNAAMLMETERFVVWDIVWPKGEPTPLHRHVYDQVGTYYQAGGRVITNPDGSKRESTTSVGAISRTRKDTTHIEEGATDQPLRAVFIELKMDRPMPPAGGPLDVQPAFPAPGDIEVLDEERVSAWDHTWHELGRPSFGRSDREAIWVFLSSGALDVTPRGGAPSRLAVKPGQIRHLKPGTVETVRAVRESPRAIIFGFK
jgi:hypothetical protein